MAVSRKRQPSRTEARFASSFHELTPSVVIDKPGTRFGICEIAGLGDKGGLAKTALADELREVDLTSSWVNFDY